MSRGERRDPHVERSTRLAKNELPRPAAPTESLRRDPRILRRRRPSPDEKSFDETAHAVLTTARPAHAARATPKLRRISQPTCFILAVPDLDGGRLGPFDRELLGAARALADAQDGAVVVLAIGAASEVDFGVAGADRLISLDLSGYAPERRASSVLAVMNELAPRHVLFCDGPTGGGDIGRRVAARLRERPASAIHELSSTRVVRSGGGGRIDLSGVPSRILMLLPGAAVPVTQARHEALPIEHIAVDSSNQLRDLGLLPLDSDAVPLPEALLVCGAGNGVTDWSAFRAAAAALRAARAGSRVACDAGLLPRDRQVGASGTSVEARCYLAFGISGAPQHLQGIARCENVIAVNTDPHAPIMKRADLAIVADAQEVMPALVRLLGSSGEGDSRHDD